MKRNYYFVAASLADLFRGRGSGTGTLEEYLQFCETQLVPEDFSTLKSLFFFNDIQNAVHYRSKGDAFLTPSYYREEEMLRLTEELERFAPFLRRYAANRIEEHREHPEMTEVDELVTIFYDRLDDVSDDFVRDYYEHEVELRNITSAFELRAGEFNLEKYLIPHGSAYGIILANPDVPDFGLSNEFSFVRRLLPLWEEPNLTLREEALDEIRWQWMDDRVGPDFFSLDYLQAHALKLASVERWSSLSQEKGEQLFGDLLATVRRSVRFEIEFSHLTEEEKAERRREMEEERRRVAAEKAEQEAQGDQ